MKTFVLEKSRYTVDFDRMMMMRGISAVWFIYREHENLWGSKDPLNWRFGAIVGRQLEKLYQEWLVEKAIEEEIL